ncbi:MAG: hypothetical protein U0414_21345 [Polyangiaceae bacterium]
MMDGLDPALLDPLVFDGRIARAAEVLARVRRRLSHADLDDLPNPFAGARAVSSKATVDATQDLASDPLFAALRGWTAHLTIERVTFDDELSVERALRAEEPSPELGERPRSFASLLRELLVEPSESTRRATLAASLAHRAAAIQPRVRHWFERRAEARRQLSQRGSPAPAAPGRSPEELAGKLLAAVASSGSLPRSPSLEVLLDASLARSATEGWPAQLNVRWLARLFGDTELVRGLALDLEPEDLPPAIGGASFARALGAFGAAVFHADRPRSRPFVLSRSPDDERAAARSWLFASLPCTPAFGRAFLSLGSDRARSQARAIARAVGVQAAFLAIAATAEQHVVMPERRARVAFEETTACAFGEPLPGPLVGTLPRVRPDAGVELRGLLLAARDRERLRDTYDEDWFKNPRAHEALRHEHAALPSRADDAALDEGLAAVERILAEAVG